LLNELNFIDVDNTYRLVKLAFPLDVTFHKAIDFTTDLLKAFKELNSIDGITRVLTSGGMDTVWNCRDILKTMNELPERRIQIIAAGKVLPENRIQIAKYTGVTELHGKKIV
jgi:copper homeostasis protein